MRITMKDVRFSFDRLCTVAQRCGLDTEGWIVEEGSATYGRAYRLYRQGEHGATFPTALGLSSGYLGMTAAAAKNAIDFIIVGLWAAIDAADRSHVPVA